MAMAAAEATVDLPADIIAAEARIEELKVTVRWMAKPTEVEVETAAAIAGGCGV